MATCPNKATKAWQDLKLAQPNRANDLWDQYNGIVPNKYYQVKAVINQLKTDLQFGAPNKFNSAVIALQERIGKYNDKYKTSHRLEVTKLPGERPRYKVKLIQNYLPVNEAERARRNAIKSEEDKVFSDIPKVPEKPFKRDIRYYKGDTQLMEQELTETGIPINEVDSKRLERKLKELFPEINLTYVSNISSENIIGQADLEALAVFAVADVSISNSEFIKMLASGIIEENCK